MMFGKVILALATVIAAFMPSGILAQQLIASYVARLSEADHYNSQGQRLASAAAIIRQDRANFHHFNLRDPEDNDDPFFAVARNRAALEQMLERGRADPSAIARIENGSVLIRVNVYRGPRGPFIRVTVLDQPQAPRAVRDAPERHATTTLSGTAFFVATNLLLTNNHVVKGCTGPIQARYPDQPSHPAVIFGLDAANDLALLHTDLSGAAVASFNRHARLGDSVAIFGFPYAGLLSSGGNFTLGNVASLSGIQDDTRFVQVSAPTQPGNSGGPLLNMSGDVIGVVVSQINALAMMKAGNSIPQNVNFAIQAPIVMNFLSIKGVPPKLHEPDAAPAMAASAIADKAKRFTVQVYCTGSSSKP
jgi:S1-C subfamily serine protease